MGGEVPAIACISVLSWELFYPSCELAWLVFFNICLPCSDFFFLLQTGWFWALLTRWFVGDCLVVVLSVGIWLLGCELVWLVFLNICLSCSVQVLCSFEWQEQLSLLRLGLCDLPQSTPQGVTLFIYLFIPRHSHSLH